MIQPKAQLLRKLMAEKDLVVGVGAGTALEAKLIERAGFDVVDTYGENLFPPVWYRGLRKILLKFKVRLPMHPWKGGRVESMRRFFRRAVPKNLYLNTAMVIGSIARKR